MPLFRRAKKSGDLGNSPVPPWCSWLGPAEWQAFQDVLADIFLDGSDSGPPMNFGERQHLRLGAADEPGIALDLAEIARLVSDLPHDQWRSATVDYLNGQLSLRDRREALYRAGFDEVRHLLMPRLVRADTVGDHHGLALSLTGDLAAVLVLRFADNLSAAVPPAQFESWNLSAEEVWDAALGNLRTHPVDLDNDGKPNPMVSVEGESGFTCTHVLRAPELLARPAPLGVLAMVPHEEFLFLQAVDDTDLRIQLIAFSMVIRQNWDGASAEHRLSPDILWVHEGEIETVTVEPAPPGSNQPGVISGSERFIALLSSIHPPDQYPAA
ncbi:hypothetical protein ACWC5I_04555 [Kitasatospora sp. NPDC001574]